MPSRILNCALAFLAVSPVLAQPAPPAGGPAAAAAHDRVNAHPLWRELNGEQREALSPLAADWDKFDADRKRKWIEIAAKYPNMSPEGKQRFHERMPQLAKLTPEQRETARENFQNAYSLPPDQRHAVTQKYQGLPPERKKALAAQAHAKKPVQTARRPAGPVREASSTQPANRPAQ
jgi:Protein of unknown function (DUF3106)